MAKLTKNQKSTIRMIAIYYADAGKELEANGVTPKYDAHMWMYVTYCDELGVDVADYERNAANRYWARTTAAA
jgi:hypothetical protein